MYLIGNITDYHLTQMELQIRLTPGKDDNVFILTDLQSVTVVSSISKD